MCVNSTLTSHAFTRAIFSRAWLKDTHCSNSLCAPSQKEISPRSHAMFRTLLDHLALLQSTSSSFHYCSPQIGLPLLLRCLADPPTMGGRRVSTSQSGIEKQAATVGQACCWRVESNSADSDVDPKRMVGPGALSCGGAKRVSPTKSRGIARTYSGTW